MRRLLWIPVACGVLMLGCGAYDPTAVCENRCEGAKADGCESSSTNCATSCSDAEHTYDELRLQAMNAGCTAQFDTVIACYSGTPACATSDVIHEMCAEEELAYTHCATP